MATTAPRGGRGTPRGVGTPRGGAAPRGGGTGGTRGTGGGGVLGGLPSRPAPPAAWVTTFNNDWTVADQDLVFQHYPAPNTQPPMPQFPPLPNYPDYHMYQNFYDIANICYAVGQFKKDRKACMAAMVFMRQGAWNIWKMREYVKTQINTPDPEHDHEIQIWTERFNDWNSQFRKPGVMTEYNQLKNPGAAAPSTQGGGTVGGARGRGNTRGRGGAVPPRGGTQQPARGGAAPLRGGRGGTAPVAQAPQPAVR